MKRLFFRLIIGAFKVSVSCIAVRSRLHGLPKEFFKKELPLNSLILRRLKKMRIKHGKYGIFLKLYAIECTN